MKKTKKFGEGLGSKFGLFFQLKIRNILERYVMDRRFVVTHV